MSEQTGDLEIEQTESKTKSNERFESVSLKHKGVRKFLISQNGIEQANRLISEFETIKKRKSSEKAKHEKQAIKLRYTKKDVQAAQEVEAQMDAIDRELIELNDDQKQVMKTVQRLEKGIKDLDKIILAEKEKEKNEALLAKSILEIENNKQSLGEYLFELKKIDSSMTAQKMLRLLKSK